MYMKYKLFLVFFGMFLTAGQLFADCIVTNNKFNESSRIIFVNPYNGSDQLAKTYTLNNIRNPYQANNVAAFESIEKAKLLANASNGDLILIKTGRQWTNYQAWEDKKLSDFNKEVMKANSLTQGECQGESLTWVPSSVIETIPSGNPSATEYSSGNGSDSVTLARTQETESLRFPNTQTNDRYSDDRSASTTSSSSTSNNRFSRNNSGGGSSSQASSETTQSTRQNLIEKSSTRNFRNSVSEKLTLNDTDATSDNNQSDSVAETVTDVVDSSNYPQCEVDAPWRAAIQTYPQDSNGWSIITPDSETRIVYVSSTDGNDSTAKTYLSAELDNPFNPKTIQPYKTIEKAYEQIRDGKPDWILFKKGDVFELKNKIWLKSGKSQAAHLVFGAYGDKGTKRPIIDSYTADVMQGIKDRSFITVVGIEFYASGRDPKSSSFVGWTGDLQSPVVFANVSGKFVQGLHFENNRFNFFAGTVVLGAMTGAINQNIVIRRNQILNSYSTKSHSQGIFLSKINSALIEENIFDHNGWYQQRPLNVAINTKDYGYATFFNHNVYIENSSNLIIEKNLSSRSSSIGMKFTSNSDSATKIDAINSYNILLNKNIIVEGEVGFSIGGNTDFDNGYRWDNIQITNNVLSNIGRTQPTNRNIAFNIEANDWQSGLICGNTVSDNAAELTNTYGLKVIGHTRDTQIVNNNYVNLGIDKDSSVLDSAENVTGSNNIYLSKVDNVNLLDMFVASQGFSDYQSYVLSVLNNLKNNPESYYNVDNIINYINAKTINVKQTFELKE
ncbi:hypothetical protein MAMP_00844 [Methylophaga aminisulfidivorans MP]|uniref:Right handed beta helix domain-containing protein n=2 Tax=Methylophaga aminisulfidivorans TaxID=230105 RepID=F5T2X4_9GAMM|nr:hypothetical protein MAMP_00844 [Methylophaga aminisulfidivorans MP]